MQELTAAEIRELFVNGEKSAQEITAYFLERIKTHDKKIGAFLSILEERALKKAEELDKKRAAGKPLGKLAAVPVAIKDNMHIEGEITSCASRFLTNYKAPFAATAVARLENEDAILIGKTNLDEFAMGSSTEYSALQKTANPWNLECVPGGSSGGSAAAVAARLCPLALGSDTGGSIRQPAAFCGVAGYKPTYGAVSRYGLVAFGSSLDQIGPFAADVGDIALAMEAIAGKCDKDSTSVSLPACDFTERLQRENFKIGIPWQFLEGADEETKSAFKNGLELYDAEMTDVDLEILKQSIAVYYILATAEASTNLARFDGVRYGIRSERAKTLAEVYDFSKEEGFGPEVKRRILLGTYVLSAGYQDAYYKKAQKVRTLIIEQFKKAFETCDVVAMPTSPFPAFKSGAIEDPVKMYLADIYTIAANLAGLPAISLPCGFTKEGLPIGLQLIAPQKEDALLLSYAAAFQKQSDFHKKAAAV